MKSILRDKTLEYYKVVSLLEYSNSNIFLFDHNLEFYDNGTITIGLFLCVIAPQPIKDHMDGDIPLSKTPWYLIPMVRPSVIPSVSIKYEMQPDKSMAFCLNNRIFNFSYLCGGFMCEKGNINK